MKIKKIGHCCLLIEEKGLRILTDPGNYSTAQEEERDIDLILITHEHQDHLHIDSLKKVLKNNSKAKIITNKGVALLLDKERIKYSLLEDKQRIKEKNVYIEAIEGKHEEIYRDFNMVQNTGFFISEKLFYPGDSFHDPKKKVEILALPVAGSWCRVCDSIDYALKIKPRISFPVHDGALKIIGGNHKAPSRILPKNNIQFVTIEEGKEMEF